MSQCNISAEISQHEQRSNIDHTNTELFDISTDRDTKILEFRPRESKKKKIKNGFFGNIIVPMTRDDEMEFICKPMYSGKSSTQGNLNSFEEEDVEQDEIQKTKNILNMVTSLFGVKKKVRSTKSDMSLLKFIDTIQV
mmetsp:Transcript_29561/g.26140  ORF Transcript_29561/g.26140 Transcript_29561/m.26140 type:complete len:138 (-) Transcript_29561:119-532(-)